MNQAGLLRLTGQYTQSVVMFEQAKDILVQLGLQQDYVYASVLNNLALVYQDTGEMEKALSAALEAFEFVQKDPDGAARSSDVFE